MGYLFGKMYRYFVNTLPADAREIIDR